MKKRKMLLSCILCLTLVVFSFIGCTDASVKNSCVRIAIQYVNYDPLLEKGEDLEVNGRFGSYFQYRGRRDKRV